MQLDRNSDTLIVGENGAGKSTILDALSFNLFGTPFRNINKPTLLNSINQSDLITECEFEIGPNKYKVVRGIKPNVFEIYVNSKLIDQTAKAKDYQEYLEKHILHYTRKTFRQVVVLGNASFTPFMQLTAADRRAVIEDLLDIEIFSVMNVILKTKLQANRELSLENQYNYDLTLQEIKLKTEHISELKKGKQSEIAEILNKINELDTRMKENDKKSTLLRANVDSLIKETEPKKELRDKIAKFMGFQHNIENNINLFHKKIDFWSNTTTCPTCESTIDPKIAEPKVSQFRTKISESNVGLKKLSSQLDLLNIAVAEIVKKETRMSEFNAQFAVLCGETKAMLKMHSDLTQKYQQLQGEDDTIENQQQQLIDAQNRLIELEKDKNELILQLQYLEIAAQLLKDSGIKTKIIKQYLPIINKLINKYLAEMDFFVNFELDENFKETIKSRHRDEFSYENFSEGEKQRIDMALLLTWREVAKLKNSAATNLLVLDEIFDSSLDGTGVEYLMKILHSLDKCNLFVISHKTDTLQDRFKSVIRFEKQGNYSRIAKG